MRWRMVWTWCTPAASSRRASRLSAAGAQRLLAANAGGYQRPAARLPYRGDVGPALGAARLAQLAVHDEADRPGLLKPLPLEQAHRPDDRRVAHYAPQRETFRQIYQQLKPLMS